MLLINSGFHQGPPQNHQKPMFFPGKKAGCLYLKTRFFMVCFGPLRGIRPPTWSQWNQWSLSAPGTTARDRSFRSSVGPCGAPMIVVPNRLAKVGLAARVPASRVYRR